MPNEKPKSLEDREAEFSTMSPQQLQKIWYGHNPGNAKGSVGFTNAALISAILKIEYGQA